MKPLIEKESPSVRDCLQDQPVLSETVDTHSKTAAFLTGINPPLTLHDPSELKAAALRSKVPIVDDATGYFLTMLCAVKQPAAILEIGSGFGYSAHFMVNGNPQAHLTSLDTNHDRVRISAEFAKRNGLATRTEFVWQHATDFFAKDQRKFDLIFLDSMKKEYPELYEGCLTRLNQGGILVTDNILFKGRVLPDAPDQPKYRAGVAGIRSFINLAQKDPRLITFFHPIGDGIMVGIRQ